MTYSIMHIGRSLAGWRPQQGRVVADGQPPAWSGHGWWFTCHEQNVEAIVTWFDQDTVLTTMHSVERMGFTLLDPRDTDLKVVCLTAQNTETAPSPRPWPFWNSHGVPYCHSLPLASDEICTAWVTTLAGTPLYLAVACRDGIVEDGRWRGYSHLAHLGRDFICNDQVRDLIPAVPNNTNNNTGDNTMPITINNVVEPDDTYTCVLCDEDFTAPQEPWWHGGGIDGYVCIGCQEHIADCDRCCEPYETHSLNRIDPTYRYSSRFCNSCYDEYLDEQEQERLMQEQGRDSVEIHGYTYRPSPNFVNDAHDRQHRPQLNTLYMGVELEIEAGNCTDWSTVFEQQQSEQFDLGVGEVWYNKSDGSISDGWEAVSHPMTIGAWRKLNLGWMETAARNGCRSWDTRTCGLHVHLSLSAFDNRSHFARWWLLHERNWEQWVALAGRHSTSYASWHRGMEGMGVRRAYGVFPYDPTSSPFCPPAPDYHNDNPETIDRKEFERSMWLRYRQWNKLAQRGERNCERYCAINVQNANTAELRFWRPSLKPNTLIATLEVIQAAFDYTRSLKELDSKVTLTEKLELLEWKQFREWVRAHQSDYPFADARIAARFGETAEQEDV